MSNSKNIIQTALDLMGEQVTIHLKGDEAFGGVTVRFGTISGLGSAGDQATVTVYDMHDSAGFGPGPNGGQRGVQTLVDVDQIKLIKRYGS